MQVKIKYHSDIEKIKKIDIGDWIDLRAAETVFIPHMESATISLGVSMKLPEGYEAIVAPRSSTFKNFGVIETNSIGIIDNSYSGTNDIWNFCAFCLCPKDFKERDGDVVHGSLIRKGDRICQFRIQKRMEPIEIIEVDVLDDTDRGGLGSTGVK